MEELKHCPFCGGKAGGNRVSHKPNCILSHYGITIIPQCFLKAWNTRYERTCEIVGFSSVVRDSRGLIEYPPVWNLSCGHEAAWWKPRICPSCGAKVVE